jgi:hypothetical protein
LTFSESLVTTESIEESVSSSSVQAISIAEIHTTSRTDGGKIGWEASAGGTVTLFGMLELGGAGKIYGENSWNDYRSDTVNNTFEETKSLKETFVHATTRTETTKRDDQLRLTKDHKPGFYRYTMFSASDVYLYVIKDSETNELYYEFREHVILDDTKFPWRFDYSEDGTFGKSDDSEFEIDLAILENLPKPALDVSIVTAGTTLEEKLSWLQSNAKSGRYYTVIVNNNESISPIALSYDGEDDITIILKSMGAEKTIGLSSNGPMFTVVNGVTLILDNNIALQGRSPNNAPLVQVNSGGTLVMNTNTRITNNDGGGVNVSGTFAMNGGLISGNYIGTGNIGTAGTSGTSGPGGASGSVGTPTADGGNGGNGGGGNGGKGGSGGVSGIITMTGWRIYANLSGNGGPGGGGGYGGDSGWGINGNSEGGGHNGSYGTSGDTGNR